MRAVSLPNGFRKLILEVDSRPDRDEEWIRKERKSNPEYEREYNLQWGSIVGTPVFAPLYKRSLHEVQMDPLPNGLVMRGWDFGFVRPACVWAQFDGTGQLGIRYELLGSDETISEFGLRVVQFSGKKFTGCKFVDYGDPAGHQRNDRSERTSIQILKDLYGIKVKTRPSEIVQGIDRIRYHLLARSDGRPGIVIDPQECPILSRGFARSYVRSETDPEKPLKDGFNDHLFDALRYMAIQVLKTPKRGRSPERTQTSTEAEHRDLWRGLRSRGRPNETNPVVGEW